MDQGSPPTSGTELTRFNALRKAGCLTTGWAGGWQWTEAGERVAWIQLRAEGDYLQLEYRVRASGDEWYPISEAVRILHVPGRYGGERPFFICPGVVNAGHARPTVDTARSPDVNKLH